MSKKYEFRSVGLDDFILEYEDKEDEIPKVKSIPFRRSIETAKALQSINAEARAKMYAFLTSIGKTRSDFIIKTVKSDGTIGYDETNYIELESSYTKEASIIAVNNIVLRTLKMPLDKLLKELDMEDPKEAEIFAKKFFTILKNSGEKDDSFPRGASLEPISTSSSEES